ncbi:MAG: phosphomannomutase/phosphoglucomutase [Halieaceae bacterium]|jgi:phosphomannomutase/phosphoglucomutase
MLKNLLKKTPTEDDSPPPIVKPKVRPDPMHRNWLYALATSVSVLAACAAFLLLVRDPSLQTQHQQIYTQQTVDNQASALAHFIASLRGRLQAATQISKFTTVLASAEEGTLAGLQAKIRLAFPLAVDVRVLDLGIKPGTAILKDDAGLRTFIEADLLIRISNQEETLPESYLHEDRWLTSMAMLVVDDVTGHRAGILLTFDNTQFATLLEAMTGDRGRLTVLQSYPPGSQQKEKIIFTSNGTGSEHLAARAEVEGTSWSIMFAPSTATVASFKPNYLSLAVSLTITTLLVGLAWFFSQRATQRKLAADLEVLNTGIRLKDPKWTPLPILGPLVSRVRKRATGASHALLDDAVTENGGVDEATSEHAPPPKIDMSGFFTNPRLQNHNMVDGDGSSQLASVPSHIFRAYDVRGNATRELSNDTVYRIARAIGSLSKEKQQSTVILGTDGRHSSPRLKTAVVNGLLDCGCDVIDIGIVTTPALSFATHTLGPTSGVMITGGHSPSEVNGLKITVDGHALCGNEISALRDCLLLGKFAEGQGTLSTIDILPSYQDRIIQDMDIGVPLTVVVDAGNAVGGTIAPAILEAMGCVVIPLNCVLNADFPNHDPDPNVDANLQQLYDAVLSNDADMGIALDGDADRVIVVSGKGTLVRTDTLLMLLAKEVLTRNAGANIVYDIKSSKHLAEIITRAGGTPVQCRTGYAFMREKMLETGAPLGAEFSGHIFFKERWFGFDDGIYAACRLIEILSNSENNLDDMLAELPESLGTAEISIPVADEVKEEIVVLLQNKTEFSHGTKNTLDGLRVDFTDGWALIRASNTSAALTLRFEADNEVALIRIRRTFKDQIAVIVPEVADKL